ncbi:MAG: hypothetical protein EB015_17375, partial [Methylocystaceae bacterium]|nr:hypothetical protein [Methylocystaceae bacterium]
MNLLFSSRVLALASLFFLLGLTPLYAEAQDPKSAKSIPKPILMLMLYCHSALDTLAGEVLKDEKPSVTEVSDKKWLAIKMSFDQNKLELGVKHAEGKNLNHLYHKSVSDGAINEGEAQFLDLTARKDALLWYAFAKEKCKKQIFAQI